ncbi:hypothetical protein O9G_001663 [Rozella allomycis CSF55]|uniref:Potassium channel domain-containing protein n=1 Tax=Rozella allomycis (strain CSF55) TaxID=988480 RepID=A0A075B284_ROZAC|nr:hypothetical protein O9G_001663 [Rozella allomycis CSF55]|eukprot:EPZ34933.1 hypothetical protein O9G_001663 [Rozella allomycis CSF55]
MVARFGRLYSTQNVKTFFRPFLRYAEIGAMASHVFAIFLPDSTITDILKPLRVIRLLRIYYILHISEHSNGAMIVFSTLQRSVEALRGAYDSKSSLWIRYDGKPSDFQSAVQAFWWSVVTLSTVGYGDLVPSTTLGKVIAGITMIFSILLFIALPTTILGSNFVAEWQLHQRLEFKKRTNLNNDLKKIQNEERYNSIAFNKNVTEGMSTVNSPKDLAESLRGQETFTKSSKIKALTDHNVTMLNLMSQMQDMLADVNPPEYYKRYKKTKDRLVVARNRISYLEAEVAQLRNTIANYNKLPRSLISTPKKKSLRLNSSPEHAFTDTEATVQSTNSGNWRNIFKHRASDTSERRMSASEIGKPDDYKFQFHPLTKHESFMTNRKWAN